MKHVILVFILIVSIGLNAQTLEVGVLSEIILYTDSISHLDEEDCYDAELRFASNMFPFVTGMELSISLDSVSGGLDSLNIYQWPQFPWGSYVQLPAEIPIASTADDIIVDFIGSTSDYPTLFYRIKANGTPSIEGEPYYCSFGKSIGAPVDGCTTIQHHLFGGEGSLDTVKSCQVLQPTGIDYYESTGVVAYPNPSSGVIRVLTERPSEIATVDVYDISGKQVLHQDMKDSDGLIVTQGLERGFYILRINFDTTTSSTLIFQIDE